MILEVAILNIMPGASAEFEKNFSEAAKIISSMEGYIRHELQRCIEQENQYIFLVHWRNLEDHTVGFRSSAQYQEWKQLLHHFYDPFPIVEHYELLDL